MRWLFLVLLASTCLAQPVEGPYHIYDDSTVAYFGRPYFVWQNDVTAKVYYSRDLGDSSIWGVRNYSLNIHRFTVGEDILCGSINQGSIDTLLTAGDRWAIFSFDIGSGTLVTGNNDSCAQNDFGFSCSSSGSTFGFAHQLIHRFGDEWTYGWFRGSLGWDGNPPAFCGGIFNLNSGVVETVLHQNEELEVRSPGPDYLHITAFAQDSFAIFHNKARIASYISLVGPNNELEDSMLSLDMLGNIERVLDVEWLGGTRFHVLGTDRPATSIYEFIRDISIEEQGSVRTEIEGSFNPTGFCRVPGFGWALIELEQDTIRLLRVLANGNATQDPEAVVVAPHDMELEWARVASDSSGNLFVYYGEVTPEYPFYRNVKYVSLHWSTPLNSDESSPSIPQEFSLTTYPNPFNSTIRIDYQLPRASDVRVSIFNTLG